MFKEVKEMIDSTIYTNGRGEVTAQNINLAMHGVIDAVEDKMTELEQNASNGGSSALRVWLWEEKSGRIPTEEQIAENIATYNKLLEGSHSGVILCLDENFPSGEKITTSINVDAQAIEAIGESYVVLQGEKPKMPNSNDIETFLIQLNADGTMVISHDENSVSSGPLRVWINEANTPEQVAENVETYKAICEGEHNTVVVCMDESDGPIVGHSTLTSTMAIAMKGSDDETYNVGIYCDIFNFINDKKESIIVILSQDGSLEVHWEENTVPSGPLRVWVPSIALLTEEQKVENANTLAELVNGYAGLVCIVSQAKFQEEHAYGFYTITNIADSWEVGVMEEGSMALMLSTLGTFYLYEDGTIEIIDN